MDRLKCVRRFPLKCGETVCDLVQIVPIVRIRIELVQQRCQALLSCGRRVPKLLPVRIEKSAAIEAVLHLVLPGQVNGRPIIIRKSGPDFNRVRPSIVAEIKGEITSVCHTQERWPGTDTMQAL